MYQTSSTSSRQKRNRASKSPLSVKKGVTTLQALDRYQKMTASQIARLIYRPLTSTDAAALKQAYEHPLYHLRQHGFIDAAPFGYKNDRGVDTITRVYFLTAAGAKFLQSVYDEHGLDQRVRWTKDTPATSPVFPEHYLKVHDALIAFESAGAMYGLARRGWADEDLIRRVLKPRGDWRQACEPDGYLWLRDYAGDLCVLLEVDRGTEGLDTDAHNSWRNKTRRYVELLHSYQADPFFADHPAPLFCFLFPTARRMDNVIETMLANGARANFWAATFDVLNDPASLFSHRWNVATVRAGDTINDHLRQS